MAINEERMVLKTRYNASHLTEIDLLGGVLCLDFVNTVQDRTKEPMVDYLNDGEDWIAWLIRVGLIELPADLRSEDVDMKALTKNREMIYRLFSLIIPSKAIPEDLWKSINSMIHETLEKLNFASSKTGIFLKWSFDLSNPMHYQYPVFKTLYDLLLSGNLARVKSCGGCGWLFLDTSKNNSRKWCDMRFCGSQDKSKRYYRRKVKGEHS